MLATGQPPLHSNADSASRHLGAGIVEAERRYQLNEEPPDVKLLRQLSLEAAMKDVETQIGKDMAMACGSRRKASF